MLDGFGTAEGMKQLLGGEVKRKVICLNRQHKSVHNHQTPEYSNDIN